MHVIVYSKLVTKTTAKKGLFMYIHISRLLVCLLVFILSISIISISKNKQDSIEVSVSPSSTITPTPTIDVTPVTQVVPKIFQTAYKVEPYNVPIESLLNEFKSGWAVLNNTGYGDGLLEYNQKTIHISNAANTYDAISLYRSGIALVNGCTYTFSFDVESSIDYSIQAIIMDESTQTVLQSATFDSNVNKQHHSMQITWNNDNIFTGQIGFNLGNQNNLPIDSEFDITLSNIRYTNETSQLINHGIVVNQVGFNPTQEKHCTFPYDDGDCFDIVNADTNEVVYTSPIINRKEESITDEFTYYGDFSNFTTPGTYYIRSQIGDVSYPFEIKDQMYQTLNDQLLTVLYMQRCGEDLHCESCNELNHVACHTSKATLFGVPDVEYDVTGGWHDAGDFGRYVTTGAKSTLDLMYSYLINPSLHTDTTGTPNSHNGIPDILDETKYELDWLLKMQDPSGNVFAKVVTESFSAENDPVKDTMPLYLTDSDTQATGYFASAMALSSMIYEPYNKDFANTCLEASKKAFDALTKTASQTTHKNPEGIRNGVYLDDNDYDERFNASAFLYIATNDSTYLNHCKDIFTQSKDKVTGLNWKNSGYYGIYLLATNKNLSTIDPNLQEEFKKVIIDAANGIYGTVTSSNYRPSIYNFIETNGTIAENGTILAMAYSLNGDQNFLQAANQQIDYLLGSNPLNMSFVTGFGTNYPHHIHHRVCKDRNAELHGALVGGANMAPEDPLALALNVPDCKRYVDSYDSYSTNEISIYWNTGLIQLISFTQPNAK